MQGHSVHKHTRAVLLASVSVVALATLSSEVYAQPAPGPTVARRPQPVPPTPVAVARPAWVWWGEGGPFHTSGGVNFGSTAIPGLSSSTPLKVKNGTEYAVGFDYAPAVWSPYHFSGQFRYGAAKRNTGSLSQSAILANPVFITAAGTSARTTAFLTGSGSSEIKEHHWLVDFAVGRDFGLGAGQAQVKLGVRVADLTSNTRGNGTICGGTTTSFGPPCFGGSPITGVFSFTSRSRFLGVGPRLGIDGSHPLFGAWTLDYLGGVAVLFGDRKLDASSNMSLVLNPTTGPAFLNVSSAIHSSDNAAVLNLDGQAGISYWINQYFKLSASYRADWYQHALRTVNASGAIINESRLYHGPMFRATVLFGGP
jgi:hypothetical protein